ncbi:GDSL esterase/lipase At5g03610-like [Momordica charantia]|uniref:GDSL esterase/lipase At5g03610-like n=1 Tax=Momordica charantia TaxID=3673 RepID=A0A6J1BY90_MOMCH|nr:GDSL esterase/lipase At5g03610-like [Momordica charantia]
MESVKLFLPLLFIISLVAGQGLAHHYSLRRSFEAINKLFVFGDSYVDTGNVIDGDLVSKYPNGITWPGKPAGRYSDGYVLTDYFASFLGLKFPIPYVQLHDVVMHIDGVNFAFGGSGVFTTIFPVPKLTDQIDFFQGFIDNSTLTPQYIDSSIALVSVSGNDYMTYFVNHIFDWTRLVMGLKPFIRSMVNTIRDDLKRIHSLGVKKVVVTTLGPLECVPMTTMFLEYERCVTILNLVVDYHNSLLQEAVTKLNNETNTDDPSFSILDLHAAFSSIIQNKGYPKGNITFSTPLEPCNKLVTEQGVMRYKLCEDPKSAFYWDFAHITHQGWLAAFSYLTDTLNKSHQIT